MASDLLAPPTPEELAATAHMDAGMAPPTAEELAATAHLEDKAKDPKDELNFVQKGALAAMHGLGTASRYAGSVTFDPLKSGAKAYIDTGDVGKAADAAAAKFGNPDSPQVSGAEILEGLGVSNDRKKGYNTGLKMGPTDIVRPTVLVKDLYDALERKRRGENDPDAITLTPANVNGALIDAATDPLTYAPTIAGRALGAAGGAEGIAAGAAKMAEERAFKAATGQNIGAYRRAARVSGRGGRDAEQALSNIRGVGRELLDNNAVGWRSNSEDIGKKAPAILKGAGQSIDDIGAAVDAAHPQGLISGNHIATDLMDYAASLPSTEGNKALQDRIMREAQTYDKLGQMTFDQAQQYKNSYKYKATDPGAFESNQDVINKVKGIIGSHMDEAATKVPEGAGYPAAKKTYGAFAGVSEAATDRALKNQSNRWVSPSDYGAGMTGALMAGMHNAGKLATGVVGGVAALANKQLRTRGSAFAARSLDAIAQGLSHYSNMPESVQTLMEDAVKRGANSVIWTHEQLMKTDPAYRANFEGEN